MSADDGGKYSLTPVGKFTLQVVLPCIVVVFAACALLGQQEIGVGAAMAVGILMMVIKFTWQLRGHRWYWVAITVSALLQIPVIFHAQLSHQAITGKGFLLFGYVDFFAVWGCIVLAKKLMGRSDEDNAPSEE